MEQEERVEADADWDSRILCGDGKCTGIIGPDGRCGECGTGYEGMPGAEATPAAAEAGIPPGTGPGAAELTPTATAAAAAAEAEEVDPDWENRVLCSDGNCIGVIGPDGRCKECGLPRREG